MDAIYVKHLTLEEGTRLFAYDDATGEAICPGYVMVGHPTIACGRALDTHGLSAGEVQTLLENDIAAIDAALRIYPWWVALSSVRQFVIVDMAFNLGINGLLKFRRMIAALSDGNYSLTATEMLASAWATQLPTRAHKLAQIMRTGHLPAQGSHPVG